MITAKRALEETKEAFEDQLIRAKNLVREDLPTIEKNILIWYNKLILKNKGALI